MKPRRSKALLLGVGAALWLGLAALGLWALDARSFAPGASGDPRSQWPADSRLARASNGFTLVVALHPECPCSQATLEELDAIVTRAPRPLAVRILCMDYAQTDRPVESSRIWLRAARIPGVSLVKDVSGAEVRCFAAETSGDTRLYGPQGTLLFHGGITGSRGHVGDNPGEAAVLALIARGPAPSVPVTTPVFGCSF